MRSKEVHNIETDMDRQNTFMYIINVGIYLNILSFIKDLYKSMPADKLKKHILKPFYFSKCFLHNSPSSYLSFTNPFIFRNFHIIRILFPYLRSSLYLNFPFLLSSSSLSPLNPWFSYIFRIFRDANVSMFEMDGAVEKVKRCLSKVVLRCTLFLTFYLSIITLYVLLPFSPFIFLVWYSNLCKNLSLSLSLPIALSLSNCISHRLRSRALLLTALHISSSLYLFHSISFSSSSFLVDYL